MKALILITLFLSTSAFAGTHFKTDSAVPTAELLSELKKVYNEKIKDKAVIKVTVEGHTDQRASVAYNQKLSERRAEAAKQELIKLGADENKIFSVGKGESELLLTVTDETSVTEEALEAHAQNRRIVVIVQTKEGTTSAVISEKKCEEKTKIKKNIVSLIAHRDVIDSSASTSSGNGVSSAKAEATSGYVPAVTYQYQFDSGIVPLLGVSIKSKPSLVIGIGYEF
jgi:VIT1/CCC1 family predicted Fe2+/Mn2+ transporter